MKLIFAWYDFWIGIFFDRKNRYLYVFLIPCIGVRIKLKRPYKFPLYSIGVDSSKGFDFTGVSVLKKEGHGLKVIETKQVTNTVDLMRVIEEFNKKYSISYDNT